MQPTGTECGRCERRRLRRRVDTLQDAVMSRDRRIADLEAACESYRRTYKEVCDLAERLERERDEARAARDIHDRRAGELEAANRRLEEKCKARIAELEAECERMHRECHRLEAHAPVPGRTLRYHNPRYVLIKRPGHCSVTDHVPEWVEVKL